MDNSPLSRLPPELRNAIYELVLTFKDPIALAKRPMKYGAPISYVLRVLNSSPNPRNGLALIETCNQIHQEAGNLIFSLNTFTFHMDCGVRCQKVNSRGPSCRFATQLVTDFIATIGIRSARAIKRLQLNGQPFLMNTPPSFENLTGNNLPAMMRDLKHVAFMLPECEVIAKLKIAIRCPRGPTAPAVLPYAEHAVPSGSISESLSAFARDIGPAEGEIVPWRDRPITLDLNRIEGVLRRTAKEFEG